MEKGKKSFWLGFFIGIPVVLILDMVILLSFNTYLSTLKVNGIGIIFLVLNLLVPISGYLISKNKWLAYGLFAGPFLIFIIAFYIAGSSCFI